MPPALESIRASGAHLVERIPAPPLAGDFVRVDASVRDVVDAVPVEGGWIVSTMGAIARWDREAARHTWTRRLPVRMRALLAHHGDVLYVAMDGAVHAWDAKRGDPRAVGAVVIAPAHLPSALAVSPDGTQLLFAGSDVSGNPSGFDVPRVHVHALDAARASSWSYAGRSWDSCQRAGFLPDGGVWAGTRQEGILRFTRDGVVEGLLLYPGADPEPCAPDDFDRFVLIAEGGPPGSGGMYLAIVDRATGARVAAVGPDELIALHPDGDACARAKPSLTRIHVVARDGRDRATIELPHPDLDRPTWLAFASDGRLLTGTIGGDLLVFVLDPGQSAAPGP